jgi:uncharacterized cupredoxin-like copper-binding protein
MFKRNSMGWAAHLRFLLPAAVLAIGAALASPSHAAGTVVNVSLWDKGGSMVMATDLGFPAAGKDMSKVTMGIAVSTDTVKAGEVTFEVLNSSKDTVHEVIVARLKDVTTPLPYLASDAKVDEDKAGSHLGEVSELDPGKTGALRLDLKPGTYLLYCNIPGHYMAGMWTLFTVK